MPTKDQLFQGQADDEGYNVRGSSMAGTGKTATKLTGTCIGHLEWDPVNQDLKLVIDNEGENEKPEGS